MAKQVDSRKRRKIDPVGDVRKSEGEASPSTKSGVLDQDEIRQHMMALMQQGSAGASRRAGSSKQSSGESEDGEDSDSGSEEEDDDVERDEEDTKPDLNDGGIDSDEEDDADVKPSPSDKLDVDPDAASTKLKRKVDTDGVGVDIKPSSLSRINPSSRSSTTTATTTPNPPKPILKSTFTSLGISPRLISSLRTIAISRPTEIQAACIEPILQGRDCIGGAKTGSGKTMAFALPILQRIVRDPFGIFAVVLTPTRELAYQLAEQFIVLGKPLGLTTVTVVGGMDMMKQAREMCEKPHIVVATPGRLVDLVRSSAHGQWDLSRVKTLVLDEADRLLTPTFAPDLGFLFEQLPEDRQTCLFTATISDEIERLVAREPKRGKMRPFVHRVESETLTVAGLKQSYLFLPGHARDPYLYYLLTHPPKSIAHLRHKRAVDRQAEGERERAGKGTKRKHHEGRGVQGLGDDDGPSVQVEDIPSTIIFTQRCATAHLLHLILTELDIPSVALHSHLSQPQRLLSLAQFRAGQVPVLVTTDVGSRGLDIPEVAMVVNFDCPRTGEDYVHRVGRTARAGRGGLAVTIVTERDVDLVKGIEEMTKVTLEEMELPEDDVLEKLNLVSTARRVANLAMQDSGFGERQAINKAKEIKRRRRDAKLAGKG